MKSYQAYAPNATSVVKLTPREAAIAFFEQNPSKRKCNVIQGVKDGHFFTVAYGRSSQGEWPESFKDVTKKNAQCLPGPVADYSLPDQANP